MQTFKPLSLGLTTRCVEYRRRLGMCVTASLYFPFRPAGQGTVWTEMSMWNFLAKEMPEGPLIDEGVVKLRSEYLVRGHAWAPGGSSRALEVVARVGPLAKTLHVFGPRRWLGGRAEEPMPFRDLPLDWQHAYGGPGDPSNPLGMGRAPAERGAAHWLPQVVLPGRHPTHPGEAVPAATLRPIDCSWPQRARHAGTYDERWLKEQSPGFANDIDWRYFNMASEDQWFEQPPRGDEPFEFVHLHPQQAKVEGVLPGMRARVFADYGDGTTARLREVPLRLATLWFFPHAERGIALFQGLAECSEDDAGDIHTLLGAIERLDDPRGEQHYLDALQARRHPEHGALYALRESDLLPEAGVGTDPEFEAVTADYQPEGAAVQNARRGAELDVKAAIEDARAKGVDPARLGLKLPAAEPVPSLEQIPEYLARKQAEALNAQVNAAIDAAEALAQAHAKMARMGIDPQSLVHRGPPTYRAAQHLAQLQAVVPQGTSRPLIDMQAIAPKLVKVEALQRSAYLQTAHAQAPAQPLPPERARVLRHAVRQAHSEGKSFAGVDLTGADLSELDLTGADFTGAWLESANLSRSVLKGTSFAYAVLAHANLAAADATGADFTGANLGRSNLTTTRLVQANLSGVNFSDTALAQTDLRGARLDHAQLHGATFGLADWRSVQAEGLLFHKAVLKDMVMSRCQLMQPTFVECDVSGVDFSAARLDTATFVKCTGVGTRFAQASLERAVFVDGCDFSAADFTQARMKGVNLRGTRLVQAHLNEAQLDEADLSESDCTEADLTGATLRGALLIKTRLERGVMAGANLMNAIAQRADLRGCTLRGANLYGSDLSRVQMDAGTVLIAASLDRAKTYPRREPTPSA